MVSLGIITIIVTFLIYYFAVLYFEKTLIQDPKIIIEKFLSVLLLYVGVSTVYFALTGRPFLDDTPQTYAVYIFIIGFISLVWSTVNLLTVFSFFKKFERFSERTKRLSVKRR